MKRAALALALAAAAAFPAYAQEELAKKHNCFACHAVDKKLVGPAYKDVAAKYAGQKDAVDKLSQKVLKGGSGVWGAVPMPANPQVSEAEANLYRQFCTSERIHAIGNGVDLDYFRPRAATAEHGCVFVGALDYRPNVDGLTWFCREVWPGVRLANPECRLQLVGRQPTAAVTRLAELPGVSGAGPGSPLWHGYLFATLSDQLRHPVQLAPSRRPLKVTDALAGDRTQGSQQ